MKVVSDRKRVKENYPNPSKHEIRLPRSPKKIQVRALEKSVLFMMSSPKESSLSSLDFAAAGAFSGFVTRFSCQPLDVLKILYQLQVDPKSSSKYTSILNSVKLIVKEEGVPGLWKGHIPAQYLSVVFGAVQFSTYENIIKINSSLKGNNDSVLSDAPLHFYAGSVSGIAGITIAFPFDTIRTRLVAQTRHKQYKGFLDAGKQIWMQQGIRGFFQGLLPACLGISISSGLVFCLKNIYTQIWNICLLNSPEGFNVRAREHMVTGLLAGITSKMLIYPLDLIKKRLQVQGMDERSICLNTKSWKGLFNCFHSTLKYEGFLGLYRGIFPTMIKSGVANAIYFTVYHEACRFLKFVKR